MILNSRYLTQICVQQFVVNHPLDSIHRIRIFGIACPSDFFYSNQKSRNRVGVCHNQESAQSEICTIWISLLQMKNDRNAMNHFDFMDSYPSLAVLIQILAILPVITAINERSFSALKYLKTYLQNTTKEVRLNSLALLYVHRDIR